MGLMLKFPMVCRRFMFILFWFMYLVRNLSGQLASLRIQVPIVDILKLFGPFFLWGGEREEKKARGDESITSHPANEN